MRTEPSHHHHSDPAFGVPPGHTHCPTARHPCSAHVEEACIRDCLKQCLWQGTDAGPGVATKSNRACEDSEYQRAQALEKDIACQNSGTTSRPVYHPWVPKSSLKWVRVYLNEKKSYIFGLKCSRLPPGSFSGTTPGGLSGSYGVPWNETQVGCMQGSQLIA